ncbi:DUF305 domain-containing protein [Nocardioides szechwanensis]|nr:DUF305 domain-containing protein [Nocardioides szechwanensis]
MKKMTAVLALLLAGVLTLASCGDDDGTPEGGDSAGAEFNDADVQFAQDMIPHHEQAVLMAEMAESHADSAEVKDLAAGIEAAQGPEIETMTRWLEDWGQDAPSGDMGHGDMGHGSASQMPGMMDEDALSDLDGAMGGDWDQMFLTMMIEHHEGAIEMAQAEQSDGENADAIALAEQIESGQTAEIEVMQDLLLAE